MARLFRLAGWFSSLVRRCSALVMLVTAPIAAQEITTGRVAGRVVDRDTGRPLHDVQVVIVGTQAGRVTDLDGRYSTSAVPCR